MPDIFDQLHQQAQPQQTAPASGDVFDQIHTQATASTPDDAAAQQNLQQLKQSYENRPWWRKMLGLGPADAQGQQLEQENLQAQKPKVEAGLKDYYDNNPAGQYAMGVVGNAAQAGQDFSQGNIKKGVHHAIKAAGIGAAPLAIPALAAAPVATVGALGGSMLGSVIGSQGAKALGASQDTQDLAGDAGGIIGGVGGGMAANAGADAFSKTSTADAITDFLGRAKRALFTTPEEQTLASQPVRSAQEINAEALPDLQERIGKVLDASAKEKGADTTGTARLSEKAAKGGAAWKQSGQQKYRVADELAAEATGQPGAFQRLGQAVQNIKEQLANPETTPQEQIELNERLSNAQSQLDAFQKAAAEKGINVDALIKAADKEYSTGLSLEEFGRGVLQQETTAGQLKPSLRPLDAPTRNLTAAASKRGHVLKNAVGEQGSAEIQGAVNDAQARIQQGRATNNAVKAAQQRVKTVRSNRWKAAGALGVGGALVGKARSAASALSGE